MHRGPKTGAGNDGGQVGVVVFQLGGPDSLAAVEPFLFNLFSDPDIIEFPFARLARPALARLISSRRARHVQEHYAAIGGRSPIRELTERQARALERELRESRGLDARVFVAMRYWHPLTEAAVAEIQRGDFRELVLLPLYPQYSKTTTGSSLNEWLRLHNANGHRLIPSKTVRYFYDHPAYLDALVEKVNEGLARFGPAAAVDPRLRGDDDPRNVIPSPDAVHWDEESRHFEMRKIFRSAQVDGPTTRGVSVLGPIPGSIARSAESAKSADADDVWLVFSAHGVPMRVIEAGDPYQRHVEETVRLAMARGGWPNPHVLCYQSRVSPGKWLEPTLGETLRWLAARGARRVLVVPLSFVTDHVETLAEINIEARNLAQMIGIERFELMPALNDSPAFIRALAELVITAAGKSSTAEKQRAITKYE